MKSNKKLNSLICVLFFSCAFFPIHLHAQWGFTISQGQRGNCVGCGNIQITVIDIGKIPIFGFPTKNECESARKIVDGISQSFLCGCTLYIICSPCTGRDIEMPGQGSFQTNPTPGTLNYNGASQGKPFFSPNPSSEIDDFMADYYVRKMALEKKSGSAITLPTTGNSTFDKAYADLVMEKFSNDKINRYIDISKDAISNYIENLRKWNEAEPLVFFLQKLYEDASGHNIDAFIYRTKTEEEKQILAEYKEFVDKAIDEMNSQLDDKKRAIDKKEYDRIILAEDSYEYKNSDKLLTTTDWRRATDPNEFPELAKVIEKLNDVNGKNGFYAQLYHNELTGEYTVSFRGSDEVGDWTGTNAKQPFSLPDQYKYAQEIAILIKDSGIPLDKVTFTGHSLGGGLASVASLTTGYKAYIYNPADLSSNTIKELGLATNNHQELITAYVSPGSIPGTPEFLTSTQNVSRNPVAREAVTVTVAAVAATNPVVTVVSPVVVEAIGASVVQLGTRVNLEGAEAGHGTKGVINYFGQKYSSQIQEWQKYDYQKSVLNSAEADGTIYRR